MQDSLIAGVIGGLGPDATVDFMARVLALTPADKDQDHIHLLVDQNPRVPNRQEAILRNGPSAGPALAASAQRLEGAGCDFIVMPCNAAHAFQAEIEAAISIPFVSIVDVTVDAVPEGAGKAGLMATPAGVAAGTYQEAFAATSVDVEILAADELDALMTLVNAIKAGDQSEGIAAAMAALAERLVERGAEVLIAGCTEIPLVLGPANTPAPLISSTDELARRTIDIASGQRPLP